MDIFLIPIHAKIENVKRIEFAETEQEIAGCFLVIAQLRPNFEKKGFLEQVKRQRAKYNFRIAYLAEAGEVKAVAGIRVGEWLAGGKYLEIEDLVTASGARSKNFGCELFDWLTEYARRENCAQLKLVSHVRRFGAHKFYLKKGMIIEAHYFSLALSESPRNE